MQTRTDVPSCAVIPLPFRFTVVLGFLLAALICVSAYGQDSSIQYSVVARSGVTSIPGGLGTFTGFSKAPAIDTAGNVVFTGTGDVDANGQYQSGIYTAVGTCCQKVADRNTLIPGGSGATFRTFFGTDYNDIDGGRVAFTANTVPVGTQLGVYTNVGQSSPGTLVEVARADGIEWSATSQPWIDGTVVAMRGQRLIPSSHATILRWNGSDGSRTFVDPGSSYNTAINTQASTSGEAAILRRYNSASSELAIASGASFEILGKIDATPMPGDDGGIFTNFSFYPVVDRQGLDAAFTGSGSTGRGVYKRIDGGPLQESADTATVIPGTPGWLFSFFDEASVALANRKIAFLGTGPLFTVGVYTDIDGELSVVVDNLEHNAIQIDGKTEEITDVFFGNKSFVYTPNGYQFVFWASLQSGGFAIIKAQMSEAPSSTDNFTVFKDFSDDNPASVSVSLSCTSGSVTNSPQLASEGAPAVFNITGATAGATCTAAENPVPTGYTADQSDCQNGKQLGGSCTIVNTATGNPSDVIHESSFEIG